MDENFKYEYGPASLSFYESIGSKWLNIVRYNESSFASSRLELQGLKSDGNTIVAVPDNTGILFEFYKEINATDLLEVSVVPYLKDREAFVVRLSDEQNKTYNFFTNEGNIYTYGTVWQNGGNTEAANIFYDATQQYEIFYSTAT